MYISTYRAFSDCNLSFQHKPIMTTTIGPVETRRKSPVLSRQELQRLILDMVD